MRALIIAGTLAAATTSASAAEPAVCYDAAVIGSLVDHANDRHLDSTPLVAGPILPRVQADTLVHAWWQVAGPTLPEAFWARTVMTVVPDPGLMLLVYLKNHPDGVPSVVGYRYAPPLYVGAKLTDYPAC